MKRFTALAVLLLMASGARAWTEKTKPVLAIESGGHTGNVRSVYFTPDGREIITADDRTIRFWDVGTGEARRIYYLPIDKSIKGGHSTSALSPDGRTLAYYA